MTWCVSLWDIATPGWIVNHEVKPSAFNQPKKISHNNTPWSAILWLNKEQSARVPDEASKSLMDFGILELALNNIDFKQSKRWTPQSLTLFTQ